MWVHLELQHQVSQPHPAHFIVAIKVKASPYLIKLQVIRAYGTTQKEHQTF